LALLTVFQEGKLQEYHDFVKANGGDAAVTKYGLDPTTCVKQIRILSLCTLAAEHEEIPYAVVSKTLQLDSTASSDSANASKVVEQWAPADIQLAVAIISLAVLHAISVWVTFGFKRPNYTIAGVLARANYWIYKELQEPRDQMVSRISMDLISGVSHAGVAVSTIIFLQVVIRVPFDLYARCCKKTEETCKLTPEKGGSDGSYSVSDV
jgi:hypothetical protein